MRLVDTLRITPTDRLVKIDRLDRLIHILDAAGVVLAGLTVLLGGLLCLPDSWVLWLLELVL